MLSEGRSVPATIRQTIASGIILVLAIALSGCKKVEQRSPTETSKERAEAKRQRAACSSSTAYDRLKSILFDKALREHAGGPANLDTLADYSVVRMENPIVTGSDPALDITRCKGNLVLQIPPGAERAFGGERYLRADIDYPAQPAADGSGFFYQLWVGNPSLHGSHRST